MLWMCLDSGSSSSCGGSSAVCVLCNDSKCNIKCMQHKMQHKLERSRANANGFIITLHPIIALFTYHARMAPFLLNHLFLASKQNILMSARIDPMPRYQR
eukprot:661200_1